MGRGNSYSGGRNRPGAVHAGLSRPVARIFYGGGGGAIIFYGGGGGAGNFELYIFLTKKWTSAVCGGVRLHPSHPPVRACSDNVPAIDEEYDNTIIRATIDQEEQDIVQQIYTKEDQSRGVRDVSPEP